jgi:hypothetical protein
LTNSQRIAAASVAALVLALATGFQVVNGPDAMFTLKGEKQTVQTAFDAMMADQHVDPSQLTGCPNNPSQTQPANNDPAWTDNMTAFPPGGAVYATPNPSATGAVTVLATHYLQKTLTPSAKYVCDRDGNVYQLAK